MSRLLETIARQLDEAPDAPAVTGCGIRLTYAQLAQEIEAAAEWLAKALDGLPADAPVAVALDNLPCWPVVDLALIKIGRASLPLPPFFSPQQRAHALADAGACLLVRSALSPTIGSNLVGGSALACERLALPPRRLHPGTAKITYTSGSTGQPKGVCLSLEQMEATAAALVPAIGREYAGLHMPVLPLGVLLENVAGLYPTLMAGGCYHAPGLATLGFGEGLRPDIGRLAAMIETCRVTSLILVPELLRALCAWLAAERTKLTSLKLVAVGGAKVSPRLIAVSRALGLPVYEGYGLSECASVVALNTPAFDRPGTVGRVLPHLNVQVADDGELVIGPKPFLGYVGGPAQVGPYRTGDLGEIDGEGALRILGRKSNLLITSLGRNIAPEWVESELLAQPEIGQAVVFGEGAAELCALLAPSRGDLPPHALVAAVARANAGLPAYARVGRWRLTPPFDAARGELTPNGRPRRAALAAAHQDFIDIPA